MVVRLRKSQDEGWRLEIVIEQNQKVNKSAARCRNVSKKASVNVLLLFVCLSVVALCVFSFCVFYSVMLSGLPLH